MCAYVIVLDSADQLPGNRFRIRSHDLYGPLPAIEIEDTGDRLEVVNAIRNEAAKLSAIHGLRKELVEMFEDVTFLEPTTLDRHRLLCRNSHPHAPFVRSYLGL